MSMFEEMNFCGNLDFFSAHPAELLVSHEVEPEATVEEDYTDDEMDVDELERRMWRDRMLLRKLKEQIKAMKMGQTAAGVLILNHCVKQYWTNSFSLESCDSRSIGDFSSRSSYISIDHVITPKVAAEVPLKLYGRTWRQRINIVRNN
ncbi:unnamed protein product [Rhodiola kirilowii]